MPNLGLSQGYAVFNGTGASPSLTGGSLPMGQGYGTFNAAGAAPALNTLLGSSPGYAEFRGDMLPTTITVDCPLPLASNDVVLFTGTGLGFLRSNVPGLTLTDIALQVYSLWGFQLTSLAQINIGLPSITQWVNAAMQMIYSNAHRLEYFNRGTKEVTVTDTGSLVLDANIQKVLGPVRIESSKKTLRTLSTRSELDQFNVRFLDDASVQPATPLAYYLESSRTAAADSVSLTLHLAPAPQADIEVLLDVCEEPIRYTQADFAADLPLQVPHKWAETILLPIVRKWAMADTWMTDSGRKAIQTEVDGQFDKAMTMLGLADPEENARRKSKPKEGATA